MNTVSDPNVAFAAERTAQRDAATKSAAAFDARVASGKLVPLGNGQFRVNDPGSWDNGEVWTQSAPREQAQPQHGLDTSTGQAALYTTTPAWHGLGNVVPEGVTDIDTVLKLGGIDYEVAKRPVLFRNEIHGPDQRMPDHFVTARTDTGAGLGVVGQRYTPIQNRDVFAFLEDLVGEYGVTWESAGALRGGRKVFVSLRLPETVTVDAAGINDMIIPFIAALNSHDGSSQAQVVVTPWRPACSNTERFALRDAVTRWGTQHTRNAMERVDEARRSLNMSVKYFDEFAREEQTLAETSMGLAEFQKIMDDLWTPPDTDATKRTKTMHAQRVDKLLAGWDSNTASLGRTAYAAERAITEFTDWGQSIRPRGELRGNNLAARATAMLEGTDDQLKSKAHRRLLTLTNR